MSNAVRKRGSLEKHCNSKHFIAGMADALKALPFRDCSNANDQWRYERGRQFAIYAKAQGITERFMQGDKPAAWVLREFAAAHRARIIL